MFLSHVYAQTQKDEVVYPFQNETGSGCLSKSLWSHIRICSRRDLKSGFHFGTGIFDHEILKQRLIDRVCSVDFSKVISDVEPFLIEKDTLRYFSSGSFVALLESWQPLTGKG